MNKRDRFAEGFNVREGLLILLASLLLTVVGPEFIIITDKKISFANVPNGKTSLQHEMQNRRSFDPLFSAIAAIFFLGGHKKNKKCGKRPYIYDVHT